MGSTSLPALHRIADESGAEVIRCFVEGAPDQRLARASSAIVVVSEAWKLVLRRRASGAR
jgi:hypothetical protein